LEIIHFQNVNQFKKRNGGSFGKHNISQNKNTHMKILGALFITIFLWITYEIWRAPVMEKNEEGKLILKRPTKKISDLWKIKN
jgi:hypothetical protein